MAADGPVNTQVVNSCCATWKHKYSKLEKGRNALREAVHLLQQEAERAQAENSNLKKALEEERARVDIEKEEKESASAARISLEKEISRLKSDISLKPRANVDAQYRSELNRLKAQVSYRDKEIYRLNVHIEREKKRADSACKNADVEKKDKVKESAAKASLVNHVSGLKSEIYSLKQRENADAEDTSEVNLLKAQVADYEKEINHLKKLIEREKKRADSESKNVEVEKKKASEARKAAKAEKSKGDDVGKRANTEREKAENYELQLEVLKKEAHKARSDLASETLKVVEANKKIEGEKQKVVKEREIANSEKAKAEEQRKSADANRKMTMEEKCHVERLSLELVECRKKIDELEKEINEIRRLIKACDLKDSGAELMSDAPFARNVEAVFPLGSELGYVVLTNFKDSSSISRICYAFRACITQCPLVTDTDWRVREILLALKTEENLFPKEKVCVLFSLLLLNFSIAALSKFGSLNWTSNPCLDSYVGHMCSVMSDWEGRSIFAEFGSLEESLNIMEEFLINGRFVVCKDESSETLIDGVHISSRPASANELVAGSIVLASICAAIDHTGFICEMSYNILRISSSNHSLILTILHVFAYLGGEKFFNFGNSNLVIILKSVVTYLEGVSSSDTASTFIPSSSNSQTIFSPCINCPFFEDAVSMDAATSLLLERLQMNASIQSNTPTNFMDCDLSDLLSLVELVAINMSWEWTSANIIHWLLKVMESCMAENVIAGVVVLLGQLGRIRVNDLGYEDKEVEILRGELSAFLCRDSAMSVGLPTQIATITALLGLLSSDFETIIQNNANSAAIASQSGPAESIRKWFSLLPKKQQDFSFDLLQTPGVNKT